MSDPRRSASTALAIGVLSIPIALLLAQIALHAIGLALAQGTETHPADAAEEFFATTPGFFVAVLLGQGAFAAVLLLAIWHAGEAVRPRLGLALDRERWSHGLWIPLALGTLGVKLVSGFFLMPLFGSGEEYSGTLHGGIASAGLAAAIVLVLLMSVLPALIEEGLFRGFVLRGMLRAYSPGFAIAVSSLLFAFAHPDPSYAVLLVPLAWWLGWVSWRTNSIVPVMWCHFTNNFLGAAFGLALSQSGFDPAQVDPAQSESIPFWIPAISTAMLVLGVLGYFRARSILQSLPEPPRPEPDQRTSRE
ncbi:MAG: CPBP family intramembrane metalloprotease [Planctomycetes bacterium]|nr:CPBP family intramembrane metalloprotease [Planctomycetota bacterium]